MTNELNHLMRMRARVRRQRHEIHLYRALIVVMGGAICVLLLR